MTTRAFILCNRLDELGAKPPSRDLKILATSYLAFLAAAYDYEIGRFRNFMSHGRQWLESAGSEDSHGRAIWAAGVGAGRSRDEGHRRLSAQLFERSFPVVWDFTSPRAWAFTLLGLHEYLRQCPATPEIDLLRKELTGRLVSRWKETATDEWPWFEASLTYDNARLSQALILSGQWMPDAEAFEIGIKSLRWLADQQVATSGCFRPIGSNGFHERGGASAQFDQQPVEAQAMVAASLEAYRATKDEYWMTEAIRAFEWFLGRNDLGLPLYDFATGGCGDGLHHDRVNENQGAESTLAFHLALAEMNSADQTTADLAPLFPADSITLKS